MDVGSDMDHWRLFLSEMCVLEIPLTGRSIFPWTRDGTYWFDRVGAILACSVGAIPWAMCAVLDISVALQCETREEVVQLEGVQFQVVSRTDPTNTKSRQFADAHGMIRIPDNE